MDAGFSIVGSLVATVAAADDVAQRLMDLAREDEKLLVTVAFLVIAGAMLRSKTVERIRIRAASGLYAFSLFLILTSNVSRWSGFAAAARGLHFAGLLIGAVAIINLLSLLLFDVSLPLVRLHTPRIMRDLLTALAYLGSAMWLLSRAGMSLSGIVTTSAVLTAVIGFSLQDTLGNIMGGLALQMDKSINVGDWVQIGSTQGKVTEIRWRHTAIETRNWDTLILPNSMLMKGEVVVLGRRTGQPIQHRMWVYFNVDFRVPPSEVISVVESALRGEPIPNVAPEPPPNCITWEYKDSYINYAVRYWLTDLLKDDPTSSVVRVRIYFALRRAGIRLSIPAQGLFVTPQTHERKEEHQERDIARRLQTLRRVELFHSMNDQELRKLAERLSVAPFTCSEAMTRQGAEAHWLYIITKGSGEVLITGDDGIRKSVATLRAGDFFGEMGMMTGQVRSATVLALEDTECYRLDKNAFHDILQNRPEIAENISHVLARRRVELEAIRDNLDAEARRRRLQPAQADIFARMAHMFGLGGSGQKKATTVN
ncbi:MAG: cyclic nucleotide-binding domain-containing protein [Terriglobales bacterium]